MSDPRSFGSDGALAAACVQGLPGAREELLCLYGGRLKQTVRKALGSNAADTHLVDSLTSDVYCCVFGFGAKSALKDYKPARGPLGKFLAAVAWRVAKRHFRKKRLPQQPLTSVPPECLPGRPDDERPEGLISEEFRARLTPAERGYFDTQLLGLTDGTEPQHYSDTTRWQHECHIRQRWDEFRGEG